MDFEKPNHVTRAPKRKSGPPSQMMPRDRIIMVYIWRWKIASTSSIHEAINRVSSPYSTYKILERLEKSRLVECRYDLGERFHVWQLTERGFHGT